jgi:hypothetical protein
VTYGRVPASRLAHVARGWFNKRKGKNTGGEPAEAYAGRSEQVEPRATDQKAYRLRKYSIKKKFGKL